MFPFHVYSSHAVALSLEVVIRLIVRFSVAILSQPLALVVVYVYVPLLVYVLPFHVYSSHAVALSLEVVMRLMVRFSVAMLSQPLALVVVNV